MNKKVVSEVEAFLQKQMSGDISGHDWLHVDRVRRTALRIAANEPKADKVLVELGALLHDSADHKLHGDDEAATLSKLRKKLRRIGLDDTTCDAVLHIVDNTSYSKGLGKENPMKSLEGRIVQDADRLDAMGAIGIARAFTYGGFKGDRPLYAPVRKVKTFKTTELYRKGKAASTIHHFYEKPLLLKDNMNTKTGKRLAQRRHTFLEQYLKEFHDEVDGRQ